MKVAAGSERGESARKELESLRRPAREMEARVDAPAGHGARGRARGWRSCERRIAETEAARAQRAEEHRAAAEALEARRTRAHHGLRRGARAGHRLPRAARPAGRADAGPVADLAARAGDRPGAGAPGGGHPRAAPGGAGARSCTTTTCCRRCSPEAEAELKDLRAQVEKMGEINLTAIDEHAELSKRFEFLVDAEEGPRRRRIEQLQEAISASTRRAASASSRRSTW